MWIEMIGENLLAPGDLLCDVALQLVVCTKIPYTRIALHFHKATYNCPGCCIQVKERKIRAFEADLIVQFFRMALKHTVQFEVRIERNQNLVPEHTLIVEVESCESQAKDFRALGRRRDQLEGKTASKGPNLVQKHTRVALMSLYAVLGQGWFYH